VTAFIPAAAKVTSAAGNRNNDTGALNNAGSYGNYWSSTNNGSSNAYNLNFNGSNVNASNNNNRTNGLTVRCVPAFSKRDSFFNECFTSFRRGLTATPGAIKKTNL